MRQGVPDGVHPVRLPRRPVKKAERRVETLKGMGFKDAQLYGADAKGFLGGLNAFFLLLSQAIDL